MKTKERGITLIALVVTVIILLILAGVAINLSVGDNGLFHKAQEAVNTYKVAEQKESEDLSILENELEKAKIDWSKIYDSTGYTPKNTTIETTEGAYYIPEGFKLADDSAGKISDGIVIEDKNKNQWVWVPCYVEGGVGSADAEETGIVKYDRYDFLGYGNDGIDEETNSLKIYLTDKSTYHIELLPEDERESVKKYGGYYIGRYEAGDSVSTELKKLRVVGDTQDYAIAIKKAQAPYNCILIDNCIDLCSKIAIQNDYGDKVFTKLTSSYAWDTALKFITSNEKYKDYAVKSPQGNYADREFKYIDINGEMQTKKQNEMIVVPTGQTIPVCNIYDMGGNVSEFTTAITNNNLHLGCGTDYTLNSIDSPAGTPGRSVGTAQKDRGFRPAMFIK